MHRLILMRHAQAEASAPSGGDEARPLSVAGRAEALLMGRALAERGLRPDLALVSAAAAGLGSAAPVGEMWPA